MKKQQSGFTLIELVVVIVILGILSAVAIPRFTDLTTDAETATAEGIKGAILSSAVILYGETQSANSFASIEANTTIDSNDLEVNNTGCDFTVDTISGTNTRASGSVPSELCSGA